MLQLKFTSLESGKVFVRDYLERVRALVQSHLERHPEVGINQVCDLAPAGSRELEGQIDKIRWHGNYEIFILSAPQVIMIDIISHQNRDKDNSFTLRIKPTGADRTYDQLRPLWQSITSLDEQIEKDHPELVEESYIPTSRKAV